MKKLRLLFCTLLCLTLVLSSAVFAAPFQRVCICLEDAPRANVKFSVYSVGTLRSDGTLRFDGAFSQLSVKGDLSNADLATTLSAYAAVGEVEPLFTVTTDGTGCVEFVPEQEGVYLIVGQGYRFGVQYVEPQPVLLCYPQLSETGEPVQVVNVVPKLLFSIAGSGVLTERHVLKVWEDEKDASLRPTSIVVSLLQDGVRVDTAELSAENNWAHTFEGLSAECVWSVVEEDVPEYYTVSIGRAGDTLVLTNTRTEDAPISPSQPDGDDPERLPQTGVLIWPVALLCALSLICFCIALGRPSRKTKK